MYHPSRGGVRGGRDQFNWEDVKVDKHRENYLGHSVKAPVGRWQRGKDLHWYTKEGGLGAEEAAEIARVKDEEEQAMREALGLAPVRDNRNKGNRLDKHEVEELLKRGKTSEELSETYTAAERVEGLGFGPIGVNRKVNGYEKGGQLEGIEPVVAQKGEERVKGNEVKLDKEDKKAAKERRREEKRVRKEEKRLKRESRKDKHREKHTSKDSEGHSPSRKRRRHDSDSD